VPAALVPAAPTPKAATVVPAAAAAATAPAAAAVAPLAPPLDETSSASADFATPIKKKQGVKRKADTTTADPSFGEGDEKKPARQIKKPVKAGLEKTRFKKKTSSVFFFRFLGFFRVFGFFFIFAQKREFLGFFSFKNTFRCIQTLNYNHSY
jgi:hypothetical protein